MSHFLFSIFPGGEQIMRGAHTLTTLSTLGGLTYNNNILRLLALTNAKGLQAGGSTAGSGNGALNTCRGSIAWCRRSTARTPSIHCQSSPNLIADSAALQGWLRVQHLQFQALAATIDDRSIVVQVWYHQNALINCLALVCKGLCRTVDNPH